MLSICKNWEPVGFAIGPLLWRGRGVVCDRRRSS